MVKEHYTLFVKMRRKELDSLEDTVLGEKCFEPIIPMIRGKDNKIKEKVYKQLTTGQQALFMFHVYYNHASNSHTEFFWWSAYFLAQPKIWSDIKNGLRYFEDDVMLQLLEEIERFFQARDYPISLEEFNVSYNNLDKDSKLLESINQFNTMFHKIAPSTLKRIGVYIRNNPDEFIQIED